MSPEKREALIKHTAENDLPGINWPLLEAEEQIAKLTAELDAWRERFPDYGYFPLESAVKPL